MSNSNAGSEYTQWHNVREVKSKKHSKYKLAVLSVYDKIFSLYYIMLTQIYAWNKETYHLKCLYKKSEC